jgi:hypothetical protein
MRLHTQSGGTLRVDDQAGELLLRYAGELVNAGEWDTVELKMWTDTCDEMKALIVVGAGVPAPSLVRSAEVVPGLDNTAEVQRMRSRMTEDSSSADPTACRM